MLQRLKALKSDRRAATAIEYGLMVGLIAVVIVTALQLTGCELAIKFAQVSTGLN